MLSTNQQSEMDIILHDNFTSAFPDFALKQALNPIRGVATLTTNLW